MLDQIINVPFLRAMPLWEVLMWTTLVVSQLLDVWTTERGLRRGAREANPVVRWLMDVAGDLWGPVKVAAIVGVLWSVYTPDLAWLVWLGAAGTTLIALRNYRIAR